MRQLSQALTHALGDQGGGVVGVNTLLDTLTNQTGIVKVIIDKSISLSSPLGPVDLGIHSFALQGIDSFTHFEPLSLVENSSSPLLIFNGSLDKIGAILLNSLELS